MTNFSEDAYETLNVFGTRKEIEEIISKLEPETDISIVDYGVDIFEDFVVALKVRSDEVFELMPKISQGHDDLGAPAMGIIRSFKEEGGGKERL